MFTPMQKDSIWSIFTFYTIIRKSEIENLKMILQKRFLNDITSVYKYLHNTKIQKMLKMDKNIRIFFKYLYIF